MKRLALLLALAGTPLGCAETGWTAQQLAQASAPRSQAEFLIWMETQHQRLEAEFEGCEDDLIDAQSNLSDSHFEVMRGRQLLAELRSRLWRASQATTEEFQEMRGHLQLLIHEIENALAGACMGFDHID